MTQAERPPKQLGIQSKKGGNINIERSKVNIAGGNIYNHSSVVNNPPPRSAQDKEDAQNRKELLDRAEGIWVPFLKASLFKEISLMLELHEQPDAVMNPWALVIQEINRSARVLPADTRIIQAYDDASRQLLI